MPTTETRPTTGRARLYAMVILTALPIAWVAANIAVWGLDLPFWDQFAFVPMLEKVQQGTLNLRDLLSQHNEHRPLFPRLIWLSLALTTGYDTRAELWVNFLLAGTTLGLFILYTRWVWDRRGPPSIPAYLFVPLITLVVFNMVQWESWLTGFQAVMYLGMGCAVIGFLALARFPDWRGFTGAVLLGIIATYSMANALLYWPIGLLLLWLLPGTGSRKLKAALWLGISVLIAAAFLVGWHSPHAQTSSIAMLNPLVYAHWLLNFLGAPLLAYPPAFLFGALSILLLSWTSFQLRDALATREILPYYAILLFIVAGGAAIGIGRSSGGAGYALAPRYITLTEWYWAVTLALASLVPAPHSRQHAALALLALLLVLSTMGGAISAYKWRYLRTLPAYDAVRSGRSPSDEMLTAIYSEIPPADMRQRIDFLCAQGWSACRHAPPQ